MLTSHVFDLQLALYPGPPVPSLTIGALMKLYLQFGYTGIARVAFYDFNVIPFLPHLQCLLLCLIRNDSVSVFHTSASKLTTKQEHAKMSTQSHACCTVPPIVTEGYKEKGQWITIDGMKTYATGPSDAKQAILVVVCLFRKRLELS